MPSSRSIFKKPASGLYLCVCVLVGWVSKSLPGCRDPSSASQTTWTDVDDDDDDDGGGGGHVRA